MFANIHEETNSGNYLSKHIYFKTHFSLNVSIRSIFSIPHDFQRKIKPSEVESQNKSELSECLSAAPGWAENGSGSQERIFAFSGHNSGGDSTFTRC